eukprot:CAMPEP_0206139098 /NCGR_PEP_ID=MMETSP1473-20131121/4840_1 /ASSEMBLY_ACC=CAM_ASM_001109 /TAXON_ID=1461547 /ORGANISM="Stichococcus sp, Strain RCC1054" /LENGTH=297 /DNA_ID=CAMNT_0053532743 /DNA_START=104 /DNA_END=998 /DNA_ORIENTATION=+
MAPLHQQLSGLADICTTSYHEVPKVQRICGFESPTATQGPTGDNSETPVSTARSISVPESPLAAELKKAGLVGLPALPKLGIRLGVRKGQQPVTLGKGVRCSRSCQNLASLAEGFCPPAGPSGAPIRAHSSGDAATSGSGTSPSSQTRSSPIDTPRMANGYGRSAHGKRLPSLSSFRYDGSHPAQQWWLSEQLSMQEPQAEFEPEGVLSPQSKAEEQQVMVPWSPAAAGGAPSLADFAFELDEVEGSTTLSESSDIDLGTFRMNAIRLLKFLGACGALISVAVPASMKLAGVGKVAA